MPRNKKQEVLVGSFTLIGAVLLALLIFLMGGLDGFLAERTEISALFHDVQGLQPGDEVYILGDKVGKVLSIEPEPSGDDGMIHMRVTMKIASARRELLRTNSLEVIDKTLTGNISVLMQQNPSGGGEPLPEGAELKGTESSGFDAITKRASAVLDEAKTAIVSIRTVVEDIQEKGHLRKSLENISALTKNTDTEIGELGDALQKSLSKLDETLASLRGMVDENRPALQETVANLRDDTALLKGFLAQLDETPKKLDDGLLALRKVADEVGDVVGENRSDLDAILTDLRTTVGNSANLTSEVKRRPWRLLYKPTPEEMKALELYDAAWAYNLGAAELHRSARDLAEHLEHTNGDGEEREALTLALERVRESLAKQKEAEELFWSRLQGQGK